MGAPTTTDVALGLATLFGFLSGKTTGKGLSMRSHTQRGGLQKMGSDVERACRAQVASMLVGRQSGNWGRGGGGGSIAGHAFF